MALSKNIKLRNIKEAKLNQNELKKLLNYDQETGTFTWIIDFNNKINAGDIAGSKSRFGYIILCINTNLYKAHRVAYLYITGRWPENEVDHDNHIRHDNRWRNLKLSTNKQNTKNRSKNKNNTSDITGVSFNKNEEKWDARISVNNKQMFLGYFIHKPDAEKARKKAENKYGFHKNHGI